MVILMFSLKCSTLALSIVGIDEQSLPLCCVAATEGFCCSVDDCGDSWPPVDFFSAGAAFSFLMTGSFGIAIVNWECATFAEHKRNSAENRISFVFILRSPS